MKETSTGRAARWTSLPVASRITRSIVFVLRVRTTHRERLRDVVLDQLPIDGVCEIKIRKRNQPASYFVMITANRMFGSVG